MSTPPASIRPSCTRSRAKTCALQALQAQAVLPLGTADERPAVCSTWRAGRRASADGWARRRRCGRRRPAGPCVDVVESARRARSRRQLGSSNDEFARGCAPARSVLRLARPRRRRAPISRPTSSLANGYVGDCRDPQREHEQQLLRDLLGDGEEHGVARRRRPRGAEQTRSRYLGGVGVPPRPRGATARRRCRSCAFYTHGQATAETLAAQRGPRRRPRQPLRQRAVVERPLQDADGCCSDRRGRSRAARRR